MRIRVWELFYGAVVLGGLAGCTNMANESEAEHLGSHVVKADKLLEPDVTDIKVTVFQAAGPNVASIQSNVDAYRAALGDPNNGNAPGPLMMGRREINWDGGGGVTATAIGPTPFDVFLNNRGARMLTPGTGFVQATPAGMAETFMNPTYADIFQTFSPLRLFSAIGSNQTDVIFFIPGTAGGTAAVTRGFGAVFADVDQQGTSAKKHAKASTSIEYFDADGKLLFSSVVPASPGDRGLSFFGIVLEDARIARVRITTGNSAPGPDDTRKTDIVVMDDFIYGEPQAEPAACQDAID
jgi:hypothetical protein